MTKIVIPSFFALSANSLSMTSIDLVVKFMLMKFISRKKLKILFDFVVLTLMYVSPVKFRWKTQKVIQDPQETRIISTRHVYPAMDQTFN